MKIAIMTDQNSGFSDQQVEELGIFQLKMPVIIDGEDYFEGVNLTHDQFYEAMLSKKDITTSQPSPGDVMDMWDDLLDKGYDEIVYIPMSSGLSTSCQNAISFMDEYDGKVQVVDNRRISITLQHSVEDAISLVKKGKSAVEIKDILEKTALDSSIYIAVDTLEFLVKSGRVTASAVALSSVLGIKPILTIQGDKLDAFAKVRGVKMGESKIVEAVKHDLATRFAGIDKSNIAIETAGSFINPEDAQKWLEFVKKEFPEFEKIGYSQLSLSIGSHVGPNSYALAASVRL